MNIEPNNIYLGDCYELIKSIPDKSVDLIVTDPPYLMESGGSGKSELALRFRKGFDELQKHNLDIGFDFSLLNEFERICRYIYIYIYGEIKILSSNS